MRQKALLWSKGLTSWALVCDVFCVVLLLSHLVSWDRCGTWLYRFLIRAVFLTLNIIYSKAYENREIQDIEIQDIASRALMLSKLWTR